jgi:hypothetical protein
MSLSPPSSCPSPLLSEPNHAVSRVKWPSEKECPAISVIDKSVAQVPTPYQVQFDPWIVIAFVWPLTQLINFNVGGTIYGQDAVGLALLLLLIGHDHGFQRLMQLRAFFLLGLFWLLGLVVTDVWRQTPSEDFLRGWLKIVFFLIQFAAMWLFLPRRREYLVAYALGSAIAILLGMSQQIEQFRAYPWKFGYGEALALGSATLCTGVLPYTRWLRRFAPQILIAVAFFLLFKVFRSGFGVVAVAGMFCFLAMLVTGSERLRNAVNPRSFLIILAAGVLSVQMLTGIYATLADQGTLGTAAQAKYRDQNEGEVSILQGGRVESLVSTIAIKDSPILGHGSWAKDIYYVRLLIQEMRRAGMKQSVKSRTSTLIPTHSYLFGAWVEGGIAGGLFWIYVLVLSVVASYHLLRRSDLLLPLSAFSIFWLMWAIPFSPFGASQRFVASFEIVLVMWIIQLAAAEKRTSGVTARGVQGPT